MKRTSNMKILFYLWFTIAVTSADSFIDTYKNCSGGYSDAIFEIECDGIDLPFTSEIDSSTDQVKLSIFNLPSESLNPNVFNRLELIEFSLETSSVNQLDDKFFDGQLELETIKITFSELRSLPAKVFPTSATSIHLNDNKLNSIHVDHFGYLSNLVYLVLDNNELTEIDGGLFPKSLRILSLNSNILETLPADAFTGTNLETLYVKHNILNILPSSVFADLPLTRRLDLEGNKLDTICNSLFVGVCPSQGTWLTSMATLKLENGCAEVCTGNINLDPNVVRKDPDFDLDNCDCLSKKGCSDEVEREVTMVYPDCTLPYTAGSAAQRTGAIVYVAIVCWVASFKV